MQDPRAILSELDAVRAEALQRLESATRAQLDARPAPTPHNSGAWSLGELFMLSAVAGPGPVGPGWACPCASNRV